MASLGLNELRSDFHSNTSPGSRGHSVHAPNQWETALHWNIASHWLGEYTKWSEEGKKSSMDNSLRNSIAYPSILLLPSSLSYKTHLSRQFNCWSLRCSWSIACQRCSNYIFILYLTPGFKRLGKNKCKTRRESFMFWGSVHLILEILRYVEISLKIQHNNCTFVTTNICLLIPKMTTTAAQGSFWVWAEPMRWRYIVTSSLIGWALTQNDPRCWSTMATQTQRGTDQN